MALRDCSDCASRWFERDGKVVTLADIAPELRAAVAVAEMLEGAPGDYADEVLTSAQVAKLLGVSTRAVTNWANAGVLAHLRTPGGSFRFYARDIDQYRKRRSLVPLP